MDPKIPNHIQLPTNEQKKPGSGNVVEQIDDLFTEVNVVSEPDIHEKITMQVEELKKLSEKKKEEIDKQIVSHGIEIGDYVDIVFDNDLDNESFVKQGPTKFKGFDGYFVQHSHYHPINGSYVSGMTNVEKVRELKLVKKAEELVES